MSPTQYCYLVPAFEDEGVSTEDDWIVYPGQVVAGVLAEILRGLDCEVEPLESADFKG